MGVGSRASGQDLKMVPGGAGGALAWPAESPESMPESSPFPAWPLPATNLLWDFVQRASPLLASVFPAVTWEAQSSPPGVMWAQQR